MQQMSKKQRGKLYLIILTIFLMILFVIAGYLIYARYIKKTEPEGNAYIDPDASEWEAGVPSPEEEGGSILIPGYSGAKLKAGETLLRLRIGNPKENTCYLKAFFQLEDGRVLYESGFLEPGRGVDEIELNQSLDAGEYQALVHYEGYTLEEEPKQLNSSDSAFILTVSQ